MLSNLWLFSTINTGRQQQWQEHMMSVMIKACVVPIRNEYPWGQRKLAWLDNLLSGMSCVGPTASRKKLLPGGQRDQLPVLYCHLRWGAENAKHLSAYQNAPRWTTYCRHQAGIWTGVISGHSTSVCLRKYSHTCMCTRRHNMWMHMHSAPTAEVTAVR